MTPRVINRYIRLYDHIISDRPYGRIKTVSFLIYKGKLLSFGVNSEKTSKTQYYYRRRTKDLKDNLNYIYDKTHSEIAAIKKIHPSFNDWNKVELLIVSKKKDGAFRLARPCQICEGAIREHSIKRVYYTDNFNGITKEEFL